MLQQTFTCFEQLFTQNFQLTNPQSSILRDALCPVRKLTSPRLD